MNQHALIEAIDATLPQTQCGKCGHAGCRPYAEAIAAGEPINRCPPGGEATIVRLAELTDRAILPLEQPAQSPLTAWIREDECIGCTKCIQACPVDAILGAAKHMHTVITDECTGCELCILPCPVDCIDLLPHPGWQAANDDTERQAYLAQRASNARQRFLARNQRLARQAEERRQRRAKRLASRNTSQGMEKDAHACADQSTGQPAHASSVSPSSLRTKRVSLLASLKRVSRQQQQNGLTDAQGAELERRAAELRTRLADIDQQLSNTSTAQPGPGQRQRRFAVSAAEQSLRRAQQQLAHAVRQNDPAAIANAQQQLEQAKQILADARAAQPS
ncbi:RnfABCDGE type electron transport complex subunit B [Halomonas binhaiensis]|nr:RnfABCDGE type electron transport complex subunit B [Halomonas binhaiensis]